MKECNVVFITDENYAMPTSVAMVSLIMNFNSEHRLNVYVICDNVSKETKQLLIKCKDAGSIYTSITFIDTDNSWEGQRSELDAKRISNTAMIKFRIPLILEKLDRVLFLDSDLIVTGDISSVFDYNIDNVYLASVEDMNPLRVGFGKESHAQRLGLPVDKYFNSGVMYLNTEKMRKDDITHKLFEDKIKHPKHGFWDQDSFNCVLYEKSLELPWKFNYLTAFTDFLDIDGLNRYFGSDHSCIDELVEEAVVLHFAGEKKPWTLDIPFITPRFMKYYKQSPYGDKKLSLHSEILELRKKYADLYKKTDFLRIPKRLACKVIGKIKR